MYVLYLIHVFVGNLKILESSKISLRSSTVTYDTMRRTQMGVPFPHAKGSTVLTNGDCRVSTQVEDNNGKWIPSPEVLFEQTGVESDVDHSLHPHSLAVGTQIRSVEIFWWGQSYEEYSGLLR